MALTFLYCLGQGTWLDDSWKLIYINHQDSTISFRRENSKMFNITAKYFSIFNNKPPASWVAHIIRDFLTCYSCLYYSSFYHLWRNKTSTEFLTVWRCHKLPYKIKISCISFSSTVYITSTIWTTWNFRDCKYLHFDG